MPKEQNASIFPIDNIPLERGAVILKALEIYNQSTLLQLTQRQNNFDLAQLLPVVETAIQHGYVRAIQVRAPAGQILSIVDLNTFQQQMDTFVQWIASHELKDYQGSLSKMISGKKFGGGRHLRHLRWYAKKLLSISSTNVFFLRLLEIFGRSIDGFYRLARASAFAPIQVGSEFKALLQLLSGLGPKSILEIGTANGGTLYLLTKIAAENAKIVSVDLQIKDERLFSSFRRKQQKVMLIEGNSTDALIKQRLRRLFLNGLDFLFIDGDHSYAGVKADFQNYFPLVNPGGVIAFHDIVESYDARFGLTTDGWSGGVPRFWKEIKEGYEHREFVENWQQDGYGIGVLFKARP